MISIDRKHREDRNQIQALPDDIPDIRVLCLIIIG